MPNTTLQGSLEDNILTMLCWSDEHCFTVNLHVNPDLFSTRAYQDIARKAIDYVDRYQTAPKQHLRDLFEAKLRKGKEGELYWKTFDAMEALHATLQADYVLGELETFVATRQLAMAIEEASDKLHNGSIAEAREALYAVNPDKVSMSPGIWVNDPQAMLGFMNKAETDTFSMGIDVLDDKGVVPRRKTMSLLIAPAKFGKSWYLINCAKRNMMAGKSVLHITLENSEEVTASRYVQSLFAMAMEDPGIIRVPMFTRDSGGHFKSLDFETVTPKLIDAGTRPEIAKRLAKLRGKLLIKEFPMSTLTMGQLTAYLAYLKRSQAFEPDMLVLDYPDLMELNPANMRIELGQIFKRIRGLAQTYNFALVTATQGNRIAAEAKTVSASHVAEDFSKIGTADIILTYSRTPAEREVNLARILVAGAREAPDGFITCISQSYATGQFCLDSQYMHKQLHSQISSVTGAGGDNDGD